MSITRDGQLLSQDDKEFRAMQRVADALDMLPHDSALRVLNWIAHRLDSRRSRAQQASTGDLMRGSGGPVDA